MFQFDWRSVIAAVFMAGACTASDPGMDQLGADSDVVAESGLAESGLTEDVPPDEEVVREQEFCPLLPGQTDWRQCAFDTTSGSFASYVADAVGLEEFVTPDGINFPIESPFTPALAHLPDGRRLLVGTEWLRSTGLWCGILGGRADLPVDCPNTWFAELWDKPLHMNPLLGELDGYPGLDLFVAEIVPEEGGGTPGMMRRVAESFGSGSPLPNFIFKPYFFTYVDGEWIDVSEERGFGGPIFMAEKLAVGFDYVDLDNDGVPEIFTRFMSQGGGGTPVWKWNAQEERFDLRTDMVPATIKVSFYSILRGPTSPTGTVDFMSIGNAEEMLTPGERGTTCWRGASLATARQISCPTGLVAGSPMGAGTIDARRDGCANLLVSDVGMPGYCEDFDEPWTIMDPCWERQDAIPMQVTDWGDEPVSWSVVVTDFNGDGWPDAVISHSWHLLEESWNQQLVILMNDGQGNFLRYRDSEAAAVKPFGLPAQERSLVITSAGDAPPDVASFSVNRGVDWRTEGGRYIHNPATAQMERIELRGPTGAYACGAYVQAYGPGDDLPTLIAAPCTGGTGFNAPQVWVPATTEWFNVIWTDGSKKTVRRAETASDSGYFPQIIQAD